MVETIIGRDIEPTFAISERLSPKPRRITAYCRIFFEVKVIPPAKASFFLIIRVSIIPATIAKTGAPTTGRALPKNQHGIEIIRHKSMPGIFCLICIISITPLCKTFTGEYIINAV